MTLGPGKYDKECTVARESTHAEGVIMIVLNGDRGCGFSAQASPGVLAVMVDLLRNTADQLEASYGKS